MNPPRPPARHACLPLMGLLLVLANAGAQANDRPFQVARTAVMEDDEWVWSFESWAQRQGRVRGLSVEPEYTFGGGRSVQMELTRYLDKVGGQTGQQAEVEFKQLFNHIARDGWGLGISASMGTDRSADEGRVNRASLKLPLSIALGETGAHVHLSPGVDKAAGSPRVWNKALALDAPLMRRVTLFAELAQAGEERYAQIGVRHWLRREKLALDVSLQQQRSVGVRSSGFILGIGWYDL